MSAVSKKVFAFASQKATKAPSENIIGSFDIGDQSFDIVETVDSSLAYLVVDMNDGDASQKISAVLGFTKRALTEDSANRFKVLALGKPGLKLEEIVQVFEYILEVISSGVPSSPPSVSSARRRTTTSVSRAKQN